MWFDAFLAFSHALPININRVNCLIFYLQAFNAGVKDIEFWLGEVEQQLSSDEYGKDLLSVQVMM